MKRKFRVQYQRTPPFRNAILNWVRSFELRRKVENQNASGRLSITPKTIQTVSSYFEAHPRRSLRRAQTDLQVPHTTVHKIPKIIIHMFRSKIRRLQQLKQQDLLQRMQFSPWCLQNLRSDPNFLRRPSSLTNLAFTCPEFLTTKLQGFRDPKSWISSGVPAT